MTAKEYLEARKLYDGSCDCWETSYHINCSELMEQYANEQNKKLLKHIKELEKQLNNLI